MAGDERLERHPKTGRYRVVDAVTGEALTGWQPSPDHARTRADNAKAAERRKPRTCLMCGAVFPSEHPGHRYCSARCRPEAEPVSACIAGGGQ